MSKLVIKCGMGLEANIAKAHAVPGTLILQGVQMLPDYDRLIPTDCEALLSFGLCGGLRPTAPVVGQVILALQLLGDDGVTYTPDQAWVNRLISTLGASDQPWYSTTTFDTADTPVQRAGLYALNQAWCIDNESVTLAQFAKKRNLPFAILRVVSDQWNDNVSGARGLLLKTGGVDMWDAIKAAVTEPGDMIKIWKNANTAITELGVVAIKAGANFQCP